VREATSCGAPTFAGIVALINQQTNSRQGTSIQNCMPSLPPRRMPFTTSLPEATRLPCRLGTPNCTTGTIGYAAGPGYDLASGLGSVNAFHLVNEWASDFQVSLAR